MKSRYLLLIPLLLLILTACGAKAGNSAEAVPTVALSSGTQTAKSALPSGSGVTASGNVVAAEEAQMAFTVGGNVAKVYVAVGDKVKEGDLLVELDNTTIQLDVAQAERNLREMTSPSAIATASQAVANARKTLEDAEDKAESLFYPRASDTLIDNTQAEIDLAKKAVARAADSYRTVERLPDGDTKKATILLALTNAQIRLNNLVVKYNWYAGTATATDAAVTQANLDAAKASFQEAQWYLSALKGEQLPPEAVGIKLAQFQSARDAVTAAQQRLEATRLAAPISGTVVTMNLTVGEYAAPAQIQVVISDVDHLKVETTDLSERDVPKVTVGQPVTVVVDALNESITGKVTLISSVSTTLGGDVVYQTTIELDTPFPEGLRAGMSVEVQFQTK
jgi:multidrug efflux pump subunit AcrA (membrane-fusion protein)